jgi:hypothetical protein
METENDVCIYVCSHKDFKWEIYDDHYCILDSRDIDEKYFGLDDKFWSEIYHFFYVSDNCEIGKYIGFCHYRRYFSFMNDVPNMDDIFSKYDVILGYPITFDGGVYDQYCTNHNKNDIDLIEGIIKEDFSDYYNSFKEVMKSNKFYLCNMFIMKKEIFLEYIWFIKNVMKEYIKRIGGDFDSYFKDNKENYKIRNFPVNYQYRLGGFLCERLTNVFVKKWFSNIKTYDIIKK